MGIIENERCDELAKIAAENPTEIDHIYESSDPSLFDWMINETTVPT